METKENINKKFLEVQETFFEGDIKNHFKQIINDPNEQDIYIGLTFEKPDILYSALLGSMDELIYLRNCEEVDDKYIEKRSNYLKYLIALYSQAIENNQNKVNEK